MKIKLISSPQNSVSIISGNVYFQNINLLDFIVEIESHDLRKYDNFFFQWSAVYRQDTLHSNSGDVSYNAPKQIAMCEEQSRLFYDAVADAACSYQMLLEAGASPEEAAKILPAESVARATAKFNLHTLSSYAAVVFPSEQNESNKQIFSELRRAILCECPWAHPFLQ